MNGLLGRKLRRDVRAGWSRFVLMVIALTVSITVFGGMLFAWSSIGRETSGAYTATEPASATIVFRQGLDAAEMSAVANAARGRPGVIAATGRSQFDTEVTVAGNTRPYPLQVFVAAPDDPMRLVRFDLTGSAWPPAAGEIRLGRDSLSLVGVAIGDSVSVRLPSGRTVSLRVAGTVYDPSLAPSPQEQRGRGYLSLTTLADAGGPALLDQLKLQVSDPGDTTASRDRDRVVAVANDVGELLQRQYGVQVAEIQVPEPYAHPHQWQADVLLLTLLTGAGAALLLSAILVATMLNNLFTQQIPQIGILKAVGARSSRIGRGYLTLTVLISATATLIALGPAVLIGRTFLRMLLDMLGIVPASLAAPWWATSTAIAVGVGLPPVIALVPLVRASRITVRAAIDHSGTGRAAGRATGMLARLSRSRRINRGLLMALRNTVRRPVRFWLSVGLLASAGAVFVSGMSLTAGTNAVNDEQTAGRDWDVDVRLAEPAPVDKVAEVVRAVPGVVRVTNLDVEQTSLSLPGGLPVTRTYPDQGHGSIRLITMPGGGAAARKLLEGRWLNPGETGAVVLNQITRKNTIPDLTVGDSVQLVTDGTTTSWRVVGIVEERGDAAVYATSEGFAAASARPVEANQLRVVTDRHDEAARGATADAVGKALTSAGLSVASSASVSRSDAIGAGHTGPVVLVLVGVALPLGIIGVIGLGSTTSANVLDRIREFGVLHAIGARPRSVRRIVIVESVALAVASCLLAIGPALVLTAVLGNGLGNLFMSAPLPFRVSGTAVVLWTALAVLGAVLATEAAATRASRITVREALAYL
ncbi:putative ABC transport system permease protein [Kribbella sp. VKM Ac-2527]|uniref:Putative ABC transport system permease protein n=1 Tax=Kribbella caucasensis TaxID=2512215 RepID=A0A4R6KEM6_9ACTN|nr:FtsX-like permease family protein [Kribbella sp. VKM Ac-2527]TDO48465.1 putative ABC transport system permease protein [Kribbella sp. VKM Ac-2527]